MSMPAPTTVPEPSEIQRLNDLFRATFGTHQTFRPCPGHVALTERVSSLEKDKLSELLSAVSSFSAFTAGNDPHAEHDFGAIDLGEEGTFFFKLDYYAPGMEFGAEDPADPTSTVRVLTVMHSSEY